MTSKIVENWLNKRATAESTRNRYPRILERFCKFHGTTPVGLIQEAEAEHQKPLDDRTDIAFNRLNDFFLTLYDKGNGLEHDSARNLTMVIKGFYSCAGVHIDWRKPKRKSTMQKDRNHIMTLDKADLLLKAAKGHQLKAVLALLRSSALSPSDLCELNTQDLIEMKPGWFMITKTRKKNRERLALPILTFLGPPAFKYLQEYKAWRERELGEVKDDDPLFLTNEPKRKNLRGLKDHRLTVRALNYQLRELALSTGLVTKKELESRQNPYGAHKYRHLFTTVLKPFGMAEVVRQMCLGHKIPGIDSSYYDTCEKVHLKEYKRCHWQLWLRCQCGKTGQAY